MLIYSLKLLLLSVLFVNFKPIKEIFHLAQIIFKKHNTSFDFNFVNLIISA